MKDITIKENAGFRLRVKAWKCSAPIDVNCVQFVQECKNKEGNVESSSTYEFFMTDKEVRNLAENLLTLTEPDSIVNV